MNRFSTAQSLFWFVILPTMLSAKPEAEVGWCIDDVGNSHYCEVDEKWFHPEDLRTRVLLIQASPDIDFTKFSTHLRESKVARKHVIIAAIAIPRSMKHIWPNTLSRGFPPSGDFYKGNDSIRQYLWRFIGAMGTDVIVLVNTPSSAKNISFDTSSTERRLHENNQMSLFSAASIFPLAQTGVVTTVEHPCDSTKAVQSLIDVNRHIKSKATDSRMCSDIVTSRKTRPTKEICKTLVDTYGASFPSMSYIPALTMRAKYRFSELTLHDKMKQEVLDSITTFESANATLLPRSGSSIGGHLIYSYLAMHDANNKEQWLNASIRGVKQAVEYQGDKDTFLMPHHNEMSDAVFMSGPLLAEIASLTNSNHLEGLCLSHIANMTRMNLRPDGLHRHSPLDSAAWGRGNGFPALGVTLTLDALGIENHKLLRLYKNHIDALIIHQDAAGMWHQVIDQPGSYAEFTSTCMIAYSILRGIRNHWLDGDKYLDSISRAATGIKGRISNDGKLLDVCTGTGKQKSLMDYFHRTAILGKDARGGAMALTFMVELLDWELSRNE
tara:strand:+ start:17164 stop:18822 length:1659 start_codon:yes stop_codon:yes gene_type:complete